MTTTSSEHPDDGDKGIRARISAMYQDELDSALTVGESIDLAPIREATAQRVADEWHLRPLLLARLAVRSVARDVSRVRTPHFKADGSVRIRLDAILRVGDDRVIAARYAREDDWLAYLAIKRQNTARIMADMAAMELGVARIIGDLREAGPGSQTLDVRPDLFERDEGEQAA